MAATPGPGIVLESRRLLLRPWRVADAAVHHELWSERDPRVPAHRRPDAHGRPTVADLEEAIRIDRSSRLLIVERRGTGEVVGYCGLNDSDRVPRAEPELAFELLRRWWGRGYATEAATAVLEWARASGHERLWASVWEWNAASRRVLAKLGFVETDRREEDETHGTTLFATKVL